MAHGRRLENRKNRDMAATADQRVVREAEGAGADGVEGVRRHGEYLVATEVDLGVGATGLAREVRDPLEPLAGADDGRARRARADRRRTGQRDVDDQRRHRHRPHDVVAHRHTGPRRTKCVL